jgi:hypothetical protein
MQIKPFIFVSQIVCGIFTHFYDYLQGYGHFISQQMLNEPLEEMMGKLLEENPSAAASLLESKGLFVMPMDLAEGVRQAI